MVDPNQDFLGPIENEENIIRLSDVYMKKTEHNTIPSTTGYKLYLLKIDSHGHIIDYDDVTAEDLSFVPTTDLWQGMGYPNNVNSALNALCQQLYRNY